MANQKIYTIIQKDRVRPIMFGREGQWCYWMNLSNPQRQEFLRRFGWHRIDSVQNALNKMRTEHPGFPLDACAFEI